MMDNNNRRPSSIPNGEPAMDTADWRNQLTFDSRQKTVNDSLPLNPGPSLLSEEPTMYSSDWRTQLLPDSRERVVNMITEKLKKHLPFCGPEGIKELRRIASRFEEKIFSGADSETDYLRKISMKMLTMETKAPNAAGSSSVSILAANNSLPLNPGDWRSHLPPESRKKNANKIKETLKKHIPNCGQEGIKELKRIAASFEELIFNTAIDQVDYFRKISFKMQGSSKLLISARRKLFDPESSCNLRSLTYLILMGPSLHNGDPAMDTNGYGWKTQLPHDSRQKIVNKIMDTLNKHLPFSGPEGINELRRIASRFEEKIFSGADSQNDYLRKISIKMLTMETKAQNATGSSSSLSIPAANNSLGFDLASLMVNDNSEPSLTNEESAINPVDWRTQLPADSRQQNIDKLMETLKKHVPYSGQEGIDELRRIAISFEDLIFGTAVNQVDYFRKISLKMQTMEEGN